MRRKRVLRAFLFFAVVLILHKICVWTQPFGPLLSELSFSTEMVDREHRLLRLSLAKDDTYRIKTPLKDISPLARKATLLYEDRYFYWHPGINPFSAARAFWSTFVQRKRVLGASTITMQLSRSLYRINSRSLGGKIEQILRALQIEFMYSKEEILEAYFNVVPYGFNIEGIGAASRIYFHKPARRLSLLESLTLAVVPQSPYERTKHVKRFQRVNEQLKAARNVLLNQWLVKYPDNVDKKLDFSLELDMRHPHELPFHTPHLATEIFRGQSGGQAILTVDLSIQKAFESIARAHVRQRTRIGIKNTSALLVDTRTMETLSYIGSVDFFNNDISGQVNGVKARRSPGSALKPFAYGLAIEQGQIHPLTMLKDAPTPFGTYTPDNFDRKFSGPLSSTDALIHSRNIPAIHVAQRLSSPSLYDFLGSVGVPLNPDPQHYGLSIVLGTAEVTMSELVELYAMLNNGGKYKPIRRRVSDPVNEGTTVLSKESSFLVLDMLRTNPRPDSGSENRWRLRPQSIAWKTGTSVGFRDAWAVGVFDHYALAVWVGDFSGKGNSAFVGRSAAGPLFFSLVEALGKVKGVQFSKPYPTFDMNVKNVEFCALSGHLPHKDCPHRRQGWFIPGVSPISKCNVHRRVEVDRVSGLQVCPKFVGDSESKVFEYWSTDLLGLFKKAGVGRKMPPALHPICRGDTFGDIGPKIMSPKEAIVYNLRSIGSGSKQIPLLAVSDGNTENHSWYVDNEFLGKSRTDNPLIWKATAGRHNVRVIDDQGRSANVSFDVQWVD